MNKNRKRVMAGAMAVAVTAGAVGAYEYHGYGTEVMAEEETAQILEDAANTVLEGQAEDISDGAKGDMFKEESVYVKADAAGNVSRTTVTEWIKNPENGELTDASGLQDIRNDKGRRSGGKRGEG